MNEVDRGWIYAVLAIVKFVIGVASFLSTWMIYGFPIHLSVLIGFSVVLVLFIIADAISRFTLHGRYLAPLRKRLLYWLSCVVITRWDTTVEISEDGDAVVSHEFWGRVNFGYNRWITLAIWAGKKQPKGKNFELEVFDVKRQVYQTPKLVLDEDKYKRFRIRFGQTLKSGDKLQFKVKFTLLKTFYFGKEDYYSHDAVHHEKDVNLKIVFPETTKVEYAGGQIMTEHGDEWKEHEKPIISDPQTIEWRIKRALHGNSHKLYWKAEKKT